MSTNMAYEGQVVNQYALKDVGGVYEDPNRICRSGRDDRSYGNSMRVDNSCPVTISSLDEPVCGETEKKEEHVCNNDPKVAMCAEHLENDNVANCIEGCVVRNG